MIKEACAFTGHRPKSFPWKCDETARDCVLLKDVLTQQITALADSGITVYLSGMAEGVDLWAAQTVLDLRTKNPTLKLHCILPCEGQESRWKTSAQEQYHTILKQADEVVYVNRAYHSGCMLERNRYMVDHSSILLGVYNGTWRSGTGATIRYAQRLGRDIILIDPISRNITEISHKDFP